MENSASYIKALANHVARTSENIRSANAGAASILFPTSMSLQPPAVQSSLEDVSYLKSIHLKGRKLRIITPNFTSKPAPSNYFLWKVQVTSSSYVETSTSSHRRVQRRNIYVFSRRRHARSLIYNALYSKCVHPEVIHAAATNKYHLQKVWT
jgi:hypothetical protein